jgi:hypothetical protein
MIIIEEGKLGKSDDIDSDLKEPRVTTLLTQGALATRIYLWADKLITLKLDPWLSLPTFGFKITLYDGRLISSNGVQFFIFDGETAQTFWNLIDPFLIRGIDEWLNHIADFYLQHKKDPKPYLNTVNSTLTDCISFIYSRMADIDNTLRQGAVACQINVKDKITHMKKYLNKRYKEVLDDAELKFKKPAETGQKATADKEEKSNVNVVNISANKVRVDKFQQSGHDSYIHEQTGTASIDRSIWTCIKKIPRWIYYILGALAALLAIFNHLGWI